MLLASEPLRRGTGLISNVLSETENTVKELRYREKLCAKLYNSTEIGGSSKCNKTNRNYRCTLGWPQPNDEANQELEMEG